MATLFTSRCKLLIHSINYLQFEPQKKSTRHFHWQLYNQMDYITINVLSNIIHNKLIKSQLISHCRIFDSKHTSKPLLWGATQSDNPWRMILKYWKSEVDSFSFIALLASPSLHPQQKAANNFGPWMRENKSSKNTYKKVRICMKRTADTNWY